MTEDAKLKHLDRAIDRMSDAQVCLLFAEEDDLMREAIELNAKIVAVKQKLFGV